jgi:hypothetical protein
MRATRASCKAPRAKRGQAGIASQSIEEERKPGGVLDVSGNIPSSITSHSPGYIDKDNEPSLACRQALKRSSTQDESHSAPQSGLLGSGIRSFGTLISMLDHQD